MLTLPRLCGCCRPASGQTVRGDQRLTKASSNPELGESKGSVGSCPRVLYVFPAVSTRFFLMLDGRGRLRGLQKKVDSACEKLESNDGDRVGYCL